MSFVYKVSVTRIQNERFFTTLSAQNYLMMVTTAANSSVNFVAAKKAAAIVTAINKKRRQQILKMLEENKRMNPTDIYIKLRSEKSTPSRHIAILLRTCIITAERDGSFTYYSLNHTRIEEVIACLNNFRCDHNASNQSVMAE